MPRRVRSALLDSRAAREKLSVRAKPYYVAIDRYQHLGYRKGITGGRWLLRRNVGGRYIVERFAQADDQQDADGETILDFWQAQLRAREIIAERARAGSAEPERTGPYTVRRALEDYAEFQRDHGKGDSNARRIHALIAPGFGSLDCAALTTRQIRAWQRDLAKTPPRMRTKKGNKQNYRAVDPEDSEAQRRRKVTANRTLAILKAALNHAFREGQVESDVAWRRVKPYHNVDVARTRYLAIAEAHRLLNACAPDIRDLVHGALTTGARLGELTAMIVEDYDPDNGQVLVSRSKTGKRRYIILNDEGQTLFDRLTAGQQGGAPIFRKADGGPWSRSHHRRPFLEALEAARIDPPICFHELRHTYASLAIMNGAPLMVVAENLGHADTRMVDRNYGHLARDYVAETIRRTAPRFGMLQARTVERLPV